MLTYKHINTKLCWNLFKLNSQLIIADLIKILNNEKNI